MSLSKDAIKEFQQIYLEENGVSIGYEEAEVIGTRLINLMVNIYKPIQKGVPHDSANIRQGK